MWTHKNYILHSKFQLLYSPSDLTPHLTLPTLDLKITIPTSLALLHWHGSEPCHIGILYRSLYTIYNIGCLILLMSTHPHSCATWCCWSKFFFLAYVHTDITLKWRCEESQGRYKRYMKIMAAGKDWIIIACLCWSIVSSAYSMC
jgi:hypothetical protein